MNKFEEIFKSIRSYFRVIVFTIVMMVYVLPTFMVGEFVYIDYTVCLMENAYVAFTLEPMSNLGIVLIIVYMTIETKNLIHWYRIQKTTKKTNKNNKTLEDYTI